ncbi:leucyl aminopeptidase family protein [Nitrospirillum pindoramense]|uniref:Leucyl aminopeptidase n=1 Tax=Nitrospirillum amazonense TaxID=28077 RepID=A0A560H628_9PROT|nr:leucyl aminopeptidase family protein [Nitrospirillum amazonense]TWB41765.1 leucyl aminopeptidase [Nitrospirillum amazonense]
MLSCFLAEKAADTVTLIPVRKDGLDAWLAAAPAATAAWVRGVGFTAEPGATALLPAADGRLDRVLVGVGEMLDLWSFAGLPTTLPAGAKGGEASYALEDGLTPEQATALATGWALGSYRFTRYRKPKKDLPRLVLPAGADAQAVDSMARAVTLVRDLINTPAEDMGPSDLAAAAQELGAEFGAAVSVIAGDDLLAANYPTVHAVGRAAAKAPCLIDLTWGDAGRPLVCLVGKGVCFDSGGLDIKAAGGMLLMKKDMGGAAHVLGLARLVMAAQLPVRLRVLVPAVENAISGNAFRPMDIITTRKGLTVEIGNTDAEGRLILCDALAEADSAKPALILDFATLTGAARIALGTELPALFANDDPLADDILAAAKETGDPLWRLPLWQGYAKQLDSKIADLNNAPGGGYGGAITAALYLERFITKGTPWAHIDLMAWNASAKPGRPEGGEAMGLRAAFAMLSRRFPKG